MSTSTAGIDTASTGRRQRQLGTVCRAAHSRCFACGSPTGPRLAMHCRAQADGSVRALFQPAAWMGGYDRQMHGGLVATLLDSAMTQCLFAHDIQAVTAALNVRFRAAVPLDRPLHVAARIERFDHRVYSLRGWIECDGRTLATAEARFMAPRAGSAQALAAHHATT